MPHQSALLHEAFERDHDGVSLGAARLTDREVLGVVLQAAALLSHCVATGRHLVDNWEGVLVNRAGLLRGARVQVGVAAPRHGQLNELLLAGLGGVERVDGRGVARRAARRLLERWRDPLLPLEPDHAIEEIFEVAPLLWDDAACGVRATLVATEVLPGGRQRVLVAGPPAFRRRLVALGSRDRIVAELSAATARRWWHHADTAGTADVVVEPPIEEVRRLFAAGRFEKARTLAEAIPGDEAHLLVARCRYHLADIRAVRDLLREFDGRDLPGRLLIDAADLATRVLANQGERDLALAWGRRVVDHAEPRLRGVAHVIAAMVAWDHDLIDEVQAHLDASVALGDDLADGWRWFHAHGLAALSRGDAEQAEKSLGRALGWRRQLAVVDAASLWNDLSVARVAADRLADAEKAQANAARLQRRLDGPRKTTVGLRNLAEIRLRRGRLEGVRDILEASIARNRVDDQLRGLAHDFVLWARYELLEGHPLAAVETLRGTLALLDRKGSQLHRDGVAVVLARALGWLGRADEARDALASTTAESRSLLGAEERPALFAHAGDHEGALAEAAAIPQRRHWQALLTGAPAPKTWDSIDRLEPLRRARLFYDWEILSPGWVPAARLRWAAAVLERGGAQPLATFLESRVGGPWEALARFLDAEPVDSRAVANLFAQAGWSHVRLVLEREDAEEVLVDGAGGASRLVHLVAGLGVLRLESANLDARLRSLVAAVGLRLGAARRPAPAAPTAPPRASARGVLGSSPALLEQLDRLARLAKGELPLLILGESGTGKELAARHAHEASARAAGSLLPVNCAALSETLLLSELFGHVRGAFTGADRDRAGVFEAARGGTVFLDEIGDLPPVAQGMLLRVLQEKEIRRVGESLPRKVDVRVVAATHRDLLSMVAGGTFRQDLYYRLRVGVVTLPPLRDRGDDVLAIAEAILRRARPGLVFSREARASLVGHSWPGNIRELENVVETAAALAEGSMVEPRHLELPSAGTAGKLGSGGGLGYHERLQAMRHQLVAEALEACGGRQAEAARALGMTRQSLSYLVRQLRLGS